MRKKKNLPTKNAPPVLRKAASSMKSTRKGLVMLALGGIGEIGGNCYAYGYNDQWLIVDYGIAFPDTAHLGVEVEVPDPAFFDNKHKNILGMVITHAHEDHIGGIGYMWDRFRCPVYATRFAKTFLEYKLRESDFVSDVPLHELRDDEELVLDVFRIQAIPMSHSIPEARLLAIDTPLGLIVHTGDWNDDSQPILEATDKKALDALADRGVMVLMADSTNVMNETPAEDSLTETTVAENLISTIAACKGRVVVTCFASNVARVQSVARAGLANGRQIALVGRSMWRMNAVAREVGYMDGLAKFKSASDVLNLPDREVLFIVTGSQGEPRAALTRMAHGTHPEIRLKPKDTVLYSSRDIPGNEKSISGVHNDLSLMGVRVINADQAAIHASGHASREQMAGLLRRLRPQILIPVHGEARHLVHHIALAKECGVAKTHLLQNGECARFDGKGGVETIDAFEANKLAMDGNRFVPGDSNVFAERKKIAYNGILSVALCIDEFGDLVADPEMTVLGLLEEDDEIGYDRLYEALLDACGVFEEHGPLNKHCESVEKTMRQQARKFYGKRPWVQVMMLEVENATA